MSNILTIQALSEAMHLTYMLIQQVCKRMRQQCLSRTIWVDALETLEKRPPFIKSRSSLLALSTTELRAVVIQSVKLDRSWLQNQDPRGRQKFKYRSLPSPDTDPRFIYILLLPEVDLIIVVGL